MTMNRNPESANTSSGAVPESPSSGKGNSPQASVPDWAVHISQVYYWAENPRRFGGKLTKRTIQWYSSSGLIPSAKRFGKEAYYNRHEIFAYLRVIEILNRKFGLLLSEIRDIIQKADNIENGGESGCVCVGVDAEGRPDFESSIVVLNELLEEYLEYEQNEASMCDGSVDGPEFSPEQSQRLISLEAEIVKRLRGDKETVEKLLQGGVITLEGELFPKGKAAPEMPF